MAKNFVWKDQLISNSIGVWSDGFVLDLGFLFIWIETTLSNKLLDNKNDFSAIISSNDGMGAGVVSVLNDNGLRVPDDIALASLDSAEGLNEFNMSMLTAKVSDIQMGEEAGQSIISLINNETDEVKKAVEMQVFPGKTV